MFLKQLYFIFFSTSIFAQLTNIENLPIRKINEYNLKRNILRNGEEIQLLNTEESVLAWRVKKKPAYMIVNSEYIYNYYALHSDGICPENMHVFNYNLDYSLISSSNIKSSQSWWVKLTADCLNPTAVKIDTILGFAIIGNYNLNESLIDDLKYHKLNFRARQVSVDSNGVYDFLPTRCVEDLTYSLKNNVYSYASLMPQKFDQLKQKLSQEVLFRSENNSLAGSQGIFNLGFNHSGENISTLTANSNLEFWNSLMPIVKNKENLPPPFYETIFPATKDVFNIILYEKKDNSKLNKTKSELFEYKDFFNSSYAVNHFTNINLEYSKNQYSFYRTSKIKVEPFKYEVYIDNILQKNPSYFISKFHLNSSLTPLKSLVFPGLGSKALSFGNIHRTHKALAITSLVLSAISFTVSEVYYQSYLRNINTEPHSMNYELANSFHKVGIVSLGIYPLISISDILSCYIKCKSDGIQLAGNKRIQRLVNKEINDNRRKNFYLCRD
jgi:hypothetical protein